MKHVHNVEDSSTDPETYGKQNLKQRDEATTQFFPFSNHRTPSKATRSWSFITSEPCRVHPRPVDEPQERPASPRNRSQTIPSQTLRRTFPSARDTAAFSLSHIIRLILNFTFRFRSGSLRGEPEQARSCILFLSRKNISTSTALPTHSVLGVKVLGISA